MGRSYHVNCMGGAIDLPSQQFKEAAVAVYFEFSSLLLIFYLEERLCE